MIGWPGVKRLLGTALGLVCALPVFGQDQVGDGRWFRMATEGGQEAAPAGSGVLDPDALMDLMDRTEAIAMQLAAQRTGGPVRDRQQEVEERLTTLIGILEREGG